MSSIKLHLAVYSATICIVYLLFQWANAHLDSFLIVGSILASLWLVCIFLYLLDDGGITPDTVSLYVCTDVIVFFLSAALFYAGWIFPIIASIILTIVLISSTCKAALRCN